MSVDRSLRLKNSLERHRNVLPRAERVALLMDRDKWPEGRSPLGMPKVGHRKPKTGGKKKAKAQADAEE